MKWYYYLHTDGNIIGKNPCVVDSDPMYFDSSFVKKYWCINTENREDAWRVILEALALDCDLARAKELVAKWNLDLGDFVEMIMRVKEIDLMKDGISRFSKDILGLEVDEFWKQVTEKGKALSKGGE